MFRLNKVREGLGIALLPAALASAGAGDEA
jgi:hypothetical protein